MKSILNLILEAKQKYIYLKNPKDYKINYDILENTIKGIKSSKIFNIIKEYFNDESMYLFNSNINKSEVDYINKWIEKHDLYFAKNITDKCINNEVDLIILKGMGNDDTIIAELTIYNKKNQKYYITNKIVV